MADVARTAAEIMMLDMEGRRLEMRDRQVAIAVARKIIEERFSPETIEDMRDVRRQMIMAAEFAAYEAIQKERELHAGDMAALKSWMDVRWSEEMLKPRVIASAIEARSGETVKHVSTEGESAVGATSAETPTLSSPRRG